MCCDGHSLEARYTLAACSFSRHIRVRMGFPSVVGGTHRPMTLQIDFRLRENDG